MRLPGREWTLINKGERRWVWGFAVAVMLATCLPYLLAYSRQGETWDFTGFVIASEDGNSYIANMQSGSVGAWLWTSPYTAAPEQGTLVFMTYLLLGKLAAAPASHALLVLLYHLFRVIAGVLAILATYDFLALFLAQVRYRRLCTALVNLGGGLGWAILLAGRTSILGSLPLEFISPEAFGFLSLFGLAHLALARAFLLWGLRSYLLARQETGRAALLGSIRTGVFFLLTALAQPLTGMVAGAVPALHLVVTGTAVLFSDPRLRDRLLMRRHAPVRPEPSDSHDGEIASPQRLAMTEWFKSHSPGWGEESLRSTWLVYFKRFVIAGAIAGPFVVYNALAFSLDPFLKAWNAQSAIPSPSPLLYLLAYALVLPFAGVGGWRLLHKDGWRAGFLIPWIVVFLIAIYLPFSLQRRLLEGTWAAWVVLAGLALEAYHQGELTRQGWIKKLSPVLSLAFAATLILYVGSFLTVLKTAEPLYQPAAETAAFKYLAQNAAPGQVVLSSYETGNVLPAWTPLKVVIGLRTLTAGIETLQPEVERFYQAGTSQDERLALLAAQRVDYVFWGPHERALGGWDPQSAPFLVRVFAMGEYQVFKVVI
jgi:hypothetical protein